MHMQELLAFQLGPLKRRVRFPRRNDETIVAIDLREVRDRWFLAFLERTEALGNR